MDDLTTLDPSVTARLSRAGVGYPDLATREFRAFHNGLRILMGLDMFELMQVGALPDAVAMDRFIKDPFRFFIVTSDEKKSAIWRALQARQPTELRAPAEDTLHTAHRAAVADIATALDARAARELEPHL